MESLSHLQTLANVPMLELDGGNWPIFKRKLRDHLEGQGIETHFESSDSPAATYEEIEEKPTKQEKEPEEEFVKRMKVWKEGDPLGSDDVSVPQLRYYLPGITLLRLLDLFLHRLLPLRSIWPLIYLFNRLGLHSFMEGYCSG